MTLLGLVYPVTCGPSRVFDPTCTTLVSLFVSEVVEEFLCLGADFGGGGDLLAADLDGDVSQGT